MTADVVVIGAGVAGMRAAVRLAAAGRRVVVVEEGPRLGGRATAFTDRETGERVDNGQHVLFGCYRETYAFLRELGTDHLAPLDPRLSLTFLGANGRRTVLRCPSWPPPWHLVAGVLRWPALSLVDRLSAARIRSLLFAVRRRGAIAVADEVPRGQTVAEWLAAQGQSPRLCEWLWNPLALAALNQAPDVAAAAPFVRVVAELFGPRVEDAAVGLPSVPLDALYAEPARTFIETRGGAVRTKAAAHVQLDEVGRVRGVRAADEEVAAAAVISTVPWHALGRLWPSDPPPTIAPTVSASAQLASSPIVTVNLWYDGPVMQDRFAGLVGGPMHWVFDKSVIFGEQAGHLSIVASGADELTKMDNAAVTRAATEHLAGALPLTRQRRLLRSVVVREHRATFSLAPGGPPRPGAVTPVRGFFLAGDWTDTGLPGTIEGAAVSGRIAADAASTFLDERLT